MRAIEEKIKKTKIKKMRKKLQMRLNFPFSTKKIENNFWGGVFFLETGMFR